MITIRIIDSCCERYTVRSTCDCLGRMYDNIAEEIRVERPESELGNVCTMIIKHDNETIDQVLVGNEPIKISRNLSRFASVDVSFVFTNESGYEKHSEIRNFYFAKSHKLEDFEPETPQQEININTLIGKGFVSVALNGNFIQFFNIVGDKVGEVDLSNFSGGSGGGSGDIAQDAVVVDEVLEFLSTNASVVNEALELDDKNINNGILEVNNG